MTDREILLLVAEEMKLMSMTAKIGDDPEKAMNPKWLLRIIGSDASKWSRRIYEHLGEAET